MYTCVNRVGGAGQSGQTEQGRGAVQRQRQDAGRGEGKGNSLTEKAKILLSNTARRLRYSQDMIRHRPLKKDKRVKKKEKGGKEEKRNEPVHQQPAKHLARRILMLRLAQKDIFDECPARVYAVCAGEGGEVGRYAA